MAAIVGTRGVEALVGAALHEARAEYESLDLLGREHEGRNLIAASQTKADACLTLDRDTRQGQVLNVSIDRALGDAEAPGELVTGQDLAAAQQQDELEEAVRASHWA